MKRKDFDFEVISSAPIGNLSISETEEEKEWHINCFETVFGKSDRDENQAESDSDSGALTLKSSLALSALSLVSLAAAIIILAM